MLYDLAYMWNLRNRTKDQTHRKGIRLLVTRSKRQDIGGGTSGGRWSKDRNF